MTTQNVLWRTADPQRVAVRQLAWVEGRRMLRHPAPWIGLVLTVLWARDLGGETWSAERYEGLAVAPTPLLLGISLASLSAFAKERIPVADEAPLGPARRAAARLLGGLPLVGLMLLVVVAGEVWLRLGGGIGLGDEPGHTDHAHFSVPELLQPVLLSALAVAVGATAVHTIRHRLAAAIALFLGWFLLSTYWLFNGAVVRWLTPIQVQPLYVEAGPASTDPTTFPSDWLLLAPSDWQDHWARLVVSPSLAAWHDVYLVALTALAMGAVIPGRGRRPLLLAGALLGVAAVLLQRMVTP